jgi:hypothetical protein
MKDKEYELEDLNFVNSMFELMESDIRLDLDKLSQRALLPIEEIIDIDSIGMLRIMRLMQKITGRKFEINDDELASFNSLDGIVQLFRQRNSK